VWYTNLPFIPFYNEAVMVELESMPLLCQAACRGDVAKIRECVIRDGSHALEVADAHGRTPLRLAVEYRELAFVEELLDYHLPNINTVAADGWTPLHTLWFAAPKRVWDVPFKIASRLVKEPGLDYTIRDGRGLTAEEVCRAAYNFEMADFLRANAQGVRLIK
jgi:ankyrin repeat protein